MKKKLSQKERLNVIYDEALMSPGFSSNPKYCTENIFPYISYNDILQRKYIIRARPLTVIDRFDIKDRIIIVSYNSLDELINDGWKLRGICNFASRIFLCYNNFISQSIRNFSNVSSK